MSFDPYRTPARTAADPPPIRCRPSYDLTVAAVLLLALGVVRVALALARAEAPSREINLAWVLVIVAPYVLWQEIAVLRRR